MKAKKLLGLITVLTTILILTSCNESANETVDDFNEQPVSIIVLDQWQDYITDATIDSDMEISWEDEDIVYYDLDEIITSLELSDDQAEIFGNITNNHNLDILNKINKIRYLKEEIVKRSNENIDIKRKDYENGLISLEELEEFIESINKGIRQLFEGSTYLDELLSLLNEERRVYVMTVYNILDKNQQHTWEVIVTNNNLLFFGQPK